MSEPSCNARYAELMNDPMVRRYRRAIRGLILVQQVAVIVWLVAIAALVVQAITR